MMSADRLKVRDAAAGGYEVLQDGEPIGSFGTIVDAVRFVRDRGARLSIGTGLSLASDPSHTILRLPSSAPTTLAA